MEIKPIFLCYDIHIVICGNRVHLSYEASATCRWGLLPANNCVVKELMYCGRGVGQIHKVCAIKGRLGKGGIPESKNH